MINKTRNAIGPENRGGEREREKKMDAQFMDRQRDTKPRRTRVRIIFNAAGCWIDGGGGEWWQKRYIMQMDIFG
jgi:hypothetical protein